jgi:hypothetical protein
MAAASDLPVKVLRHSGLRVASISLRPGCYGNPNQEADKVTLGQDINIKVPHAVMALMNGQGHKWLTSSRMAQELLCEKPRVRFETV